MSVGVVLQSVSPTVVLRVLLEGLGTAGVYIMIASGLTLIFGLMGVLNFAHGALTTVGGYVGGGLLVAFVAASASGVGLFAQWLLLMVVTGVILAFLGSVIEVGLIRKLYDRPPIDQILLTFGVALVIQELIFMILWEWLDRNPDPTAHWNAAERLGPEIAQGGARLDLPGFSVRGIVPIKIVLGALVVVAVWAFLNRTRYGLYIRAGTEDAEMAQALGINVQRVFTVVFGLGIGLAGMAGMFLIWDRSYDLTWLMGAEALLPAFIVVVVGGLGTFKGTVVASIIAGIFFETGVYLQTNYITWFAELHSTLLFALLVIVLIVRPQGLYGQEEVGGH